MIHSATEESVVWRPPVAERENISAVCFKCDDNTRTSSFSPGMLSPLSSRLIYLLLIYFKWCFLFKESVGNIKKKANWRPSQRTGC